MRNDLVHRKWGGSPDPRGPPGSRSSTNRYLPGTRFALHAVPAEYPQNIEISSPPKARETSPVKLIFAVDNVPAERNRLEAMGVRMVDRPWQNPAEQCEGIDPEGNIFQISRAVAM
jgi:predicted enzyme related to lactoylglutathione lyase